MQSKKELRLLGRDSPDRADSLAMTFIVDSISKKASAKVRAQPPVRRRVVW
jgi:hypothetical protein